MVDRTENLSRLAKGAAPFAMGVMGVIVLALPVRLFEGLIPMPVIPLAVIFFWTVYEPEKLPATSVFIVGLFQDAITGAPFGLWSTVYLVVQFAVLSQRAYFLGRDPQVVWLGFSLVAGVVALIIWLVMSLMAGFLLPVRSLLIQIAATIAFYPLMGRGFRRIRHRVLQEV